jgi:hypothetical protein
MALFSVGDAILKFVSDTTELDASFDRIQAESAAKLAPVQAQAAAVGAALDGVTASAQGTSAALGQTGVEGQKAVSAVSSAYVKLAQATAANQQAQQSVRIALSNVRQTGGESAQAITLLAEAQEKAALAAKNLADAQAAVRVESQGVTVAEQEAGAAAVLMGNEMSEAGAKASFSMQEAKGTIALVGEEAGITVPRHLRGFIAQLPGVGAALEAAFSAVAIFVLVQLLVEATEKLTEFISETLIYTERDKEMYAATVELNKALAEQSTKLTELQKAYNLIGLEGPAKTRAEFMALTEEVRKNEEALRLAQNTLAKYRLEQQSVDFSAVHSISEEEANKSAETILKLTSLLKTQYQQQANLGKNFDIEDLQEKIQHGQALISADQSLGNARIALLQAGSRLRLLAIKAGYSDEIAEDQRFAQMKYELQLATLKRERDNFALDPTKNADQIRAKNVEIEALESQHEANLIDIHIKGIRALQAAIAQAATVTQSSPIDAIIPPPSELARRVQEISDLLGQFGIKSGQVWQTEADNAQAALSKVADALRSGEATYAEYIQIKEKALEADLGKAINLGNPSEIDQITESLKALRAEMVKLGLVTDKEAKNEDHLNAIQRRWAQFWGHDGKKAGKDMVSISDLGKKALLDLADGFAQSVAAAELGADGFGEAMKKMLAATLASISGQAAIEALMEVARAIWCAANPLTAAARGESVGGHLVAAAKFAAVAAIAGVGAAALSGGGGGSGEPGAPKDAKPIETSGATQTEAQPVQTTNVQRFATGGLILGPTLAVIGDAAGSTSSALSGPGQVEAAIPLNDDSATGPIARALVKHMPKPEIHLHVHGATLKQFIKSVNQEVKNGNVTLYASHAGAVRKKS